jgi:hypothetical protein
VFHKAHDHKKTRNETKEREAWRHTFQRLDYTGKRRWLVSMPQGPATPDLEAGPCCQRHTEKRERRFGCISTGILNSSTIIFTYLISRWSPFSLSLSSPIKEQYTKRDIS